uniref:Uncharacterized protein n=1 Tax=Anguilla anguilla TaxID=7936 RepID=A0A0E9S9Y0_ANGAN
MKNEKVQHSFKFLQCVALCLVNMYITTMVCSYDVLLRFTPPMTPPYLLGSVV